MNGDTSLVIPGRNVERTLGVCLDSVLPYLEQGALREILFVDDGSTDGTVELAGKYPVTILRAGGLGPGGARNVGWRAAKGETVWFIDADCVAKPGALEVLRRHLEDPAVGGAGGSYANELPGSLLARVIHAEIVERHRRMPERVGYLATYNVLYRREVLEALDGFDENRFNAPGKPGAEDIDMAYRAVAAGWELRFDRGSVVGHHHPTRLLSYLRTQRNHGFWRVALHLQHRRQSAGDDYSGLVDHLQPVVAVASLVVGALEGRRILPKGASVLPTAFLVLSQIPMAARISREGEHTAAALYVPVGVVRAYARAMGLVLGVGSWLDRLVRDHRGDGASESTRVAPASRKAPASRPEPRARAQIRSERV